jgi:hypothetical protein
MRKKFVSISLMMIFLLSLAMPFSHAVSGEVPSGWSKAEVESLIQKEIIPEELRCEYQKPITREEFTAVVVRMCEYTVGTFSEVKNVFIDIGDSAYKKEILNAQQLGIVEGTSSATFSPKGLLTREQAAKILSATVRQMRGTEIPEKYTISFNDKNAISSWAKKYVAFCTSYGLMNGTGNNQFSPQKTLTREEAYAVVNRMIKKHAWANIQDIVILKNSKGYTSLINSMKQKTDTTEFLWIEKFIDFVGDGSVQLVSIFDELHYDSDFEDFVPIVKFGIWNCDENQFICCGQIEEYSAYAGGDYLSIAKVKYNQKYYIDAIYKFFDGPYLVEEKHELYEYKNGQLELKHIFSTTEIMNEGDVLGYTIDGKIVSEAYFEQVINSLSAVTLIDTSNAEMSAEFDEIVGFWSLDSVSLDGEIEMSIHELEEISGEELDIIFDIWEDGTFTGYAMGEVGDGTWRKEGNAYILTIEGDDQIVTLKNGRMVIKDDNLLMFFTK